MRWLFVAVAAVSLLGCGIPPAVSVASLALDFASYGSTGKTVTDHGISMVLREDCALLRVLDGPICVEESEEGIATRKPARDDETPASRRFAYLADDVNRVMSPYAAEGFEPEDLGTLQISFAADPAIRPGLGVAHPAGSGGTPHEIASAAATDVLGVAGYLGGDVRPAGKRRVRRQLSGTRYLAHGIISSHRGPTDRGTSG
jgi:hypothetical protein